MCMYHPHQHMTNHSNMNQEDGMEPFIHSYSAKQQGEMPERMHNCAAPVCRKEKQSLHSLSKEDNIKKMAEVYSWGTP